MRVIKELNNISPELKAKIKPLEKNDVAIYQVKEYNIVEDPQTGVKTTHYTRRQIWLKDSIWDVHSKDGAKFVDIGVPQTIINNEVSLFKTLDFDNPSAGCIYLRGSNVEEREIDEFLQLTNMSENSILGEDRNQNVEIILLRIDRAKEAKNKVSKRNLRREALNFHALMDNRDKREFAASMDWPHQVAIEELDDRIGEYIEEFPEDFVKAVESTDTKRKATIKYAIEEGIINWQPDTNKIVWGNGSGTVASLERVDGKNHIDMFNDWLSTSVNGDKILQQLKKKAKAETV